jgi:hypothetical protein
MSRGRLSVTTTTDGRVSQRVIPEILTGKRLNTLGRARVDQPSRSNSTPVPKDAREATEAQREEEEQLEHQDDDPDAPGSHQSQRQLPDESTR